MDPSSLILTASTDTAPFFYVVGGVLVLLSVVVAFLGIRSEGFPSGGALRAVGGVMAVLVVATATLAVITAREEQAIRREENEEAARESAEAAEEGVEQEAAETEGEAAGPDDEGTGGGGANGAPADLELGASVFEGQGCGSCHTLAAAGATGTIGPDFDEVLPGQSAEMIRTSIVDPDAEVAEGFPAGTMPGNYGDTLTPEQLDALVAYQQESAGSS